MTDPRREIARRLRQEWWRPNGAAAIVVGLVGLVAAFGWLNWYRSSTKLDIACAEIDRLYETSGLVTGYPARKVERACACANGACAETSDD